jgi:hypothetical protein
VDGFIYGGVPVPWKVWAIPLLAWSSFMTALFGASMCMLIIFRKQWITYERLAFPLAQIPLETIQEQTGQPQGLLPRSRLFWLGLTTGLVFNFWYNLAGRWPVMPACPFFWRTLMAWQKTGPLAGLGSIILHIQPAVLAIVYLIPTELSFSTWFFWLLRLLANTIAIAFGVTAMMPESWNGAFPDPYNTGTGAVLALGLWSIWIARKYLARICKSVVSRKATNPEGEDDLSYRWAFVGLLLCLVWLVLFCVLSGSRPFFAIGFIVILVGSYIVFARVQAETALIPVVGDSISWILAPTGSRGLKPGELVTLMTMRWATFPIPSMIFPAIVLNAFQSFKVADAAHIKSRSLTQALFLGFVFTLLTGTIVFLFGTYQVGYYGTSVGAAPWWPSLQSRMEGNVITQAIVTPQGPDAGQLAHMAGGALFCLLLGILRLQFWWWPLHPIGFIVAMGWGIPWEFFPFFLAWLGKTLIVRYGGLKLYRLTVPLAMGIIIGEVTNDVIWAILSALLTK